MNDSEDAYDVAMQEGYREESLYYAQALQLAERITADLRQGFRTDDDFRKLNGLFVQIAEIETRLTALPRPAKSSDGGARTTRAKAEVIALLERLLAEIREGEREAVARRDLLLVPLEMGIRARRMQQAYRDRS